MPLSIREEVMAALLAYDEANGWAGELDGSAHVSSYTGAHNWRTDEVEASDEALIDLFQREWAGYLQRHGTASALVSELAEAFESDPCVDNLVELVSAMRLEPRSSTPPA